jgi:hypothetical protein
MDLIFKLTSIGSLVLTLAGVAAILVNNGKGRQHIDDRLSNIDEALDHLNGHLNNAKIHINPELAQHLMDDHKDWRRGVDGKLSVLNDNLNTLLDRKAR